jgi:2-dehydropantoate 2-reductase
MIGPQSLVLTMQNGIGNAERIQKHIGSHNLLIGIAEGFGASIQKPGHVHHHGWTMIHLGEHGQKLGGRVMNVARVWKAAGFRVRTHKDIRPALWGKLVCNVGFSAICTVAGLKIGQVLTNAHAWQIAAGCAREAASVALAKGVRLSFRSAEAWIKRFGMKIPGAKPSMLLDLEAGRPCEIDSLNGAVVREAVSEGIEAPTNSVMTILVKAMQERRVVLGQPYGLV